MGQGLPKIIDQNPFFTAVDDNNSDKIANNVAFAWMMHDVKSCRCLFMHHNERNWSHDNCFK